MPLKSSKPTTPGRRGAVFQTSDDITRREPKSSLLLPLKKRAGRTRSGKISVRHRGGGHKKNYRVIDFKRNKRDIPAKVAEIEYDPNRSARIALLHYADGEKRYILAPSGLVKGGSVLAGETAERGMDNFLYFLGLLSVNLAILNLLPIPVLDGGHLFFMILETLMRRPLSLRKREFFQQVGMVIILGIMVLVTFNDLNQLVFHHIVDFFQ